MSIAGRRNGRSRWSVKASPLFKRRLEEREAENPGLRRVLEGIAWELACDPFKWAHRVEEDDAPELSGEEPLWTVESTREFAGAPVVYVYFTIWQGRRLTLQTFEGAEEWEDQRFNDAH